MYQLYLATLQQRYLSLYEPSQHSKFLDMVFRNCISLFGVTKARFYRLQTRPGSSTSISKMLVSPQDLGQTSAAFSTSSVSSPASVSSSDNTLRENIDRIHADLLNKAKSETDEYKKLKILAEIILASHIPTLMKEENFIEIIEKSPNLLKEIEYIRNILNVIGPNRSENIQLMSGFLRHDPRTKFNYKKIQALIQAYFS